VPTFLNGCFKQPLTSVRLIRIYGDVGYLMEIHQLINQLRIIHL